jgi:predicted MFS family arabinose efflux permease
MLRTAPSTDESLSQTEMAVVPARVSGALIALLAVCCALSVANVYYAQPLLDMLADDFGIARAAIGGVISATQLGCAAALLLVVPLGDLFDRRRLIAVQLVLLTAALLLMAAAHSRTQLLLGMAALGVLGKAMTQGLLACAASMAAPHERGRVVGGAQGGVVMGLLLGRALSGTIAELFSWRAVYLFSAGASVAMLLALWPALAGQRRPRARLSYLKLLRSLFTLVLHERVLQVRGMLALLLFAAFGIFWSALVLPLSAPPHALSHTAIGAFGLVGAVGAVGALAAAHAGRLADCGLGQATTGIALALLLLAWWPLSHGMHAWWALIVGIVLLDMGGQAVHVVNQNMALAIDPAASSRLVAGYMLFYAAGSGAGALAATTVYALVGWSGVCLLGATVSLVALLLWAVTLRWMPTVVRAGRAPS